MMVHERRLTLAAGTEDAGRRVDRYLADRLPELSRARLQALLRGGHLSSGGSVIADPAERVKPGQRFELTVPPPRPAQPAAEGIALDVLYEDDDLLVLDKPAGMVVHPAPGHAGATLVNALLAHCAGSLSGVGGVQRPGIVHRIDKDVSGLLVVAKHDRAHIGLAGQFSVHSVERTYDALVLGVPRGRGGSVDRPIGRDPRFRKRMAVLASGGKRALTHYTVEETFGREAALLRCRLATGRTHQIRVHLASLGCPLAGDALYGRRKPPSGPLAAALQGFGRIALHARVLGFTHPCSGERLRFERPPPAAFGHLLERLRELFTSLNDL